MRKRRNWAKDGEEKRNRSAEEEEGGEGPMNGRIIKRVINALRFLRMDESFISKRQKWGGEAANGTWKKRKGFLQESKIQIQ